MNDSRLHGWHLKWGLSGSLNLWHLLVLHRFGVRSRLTVIRPLSVGIWMVLVLEPQFSCQEKTQSHPVLWFEGLHEALGEVSGENRTLHPETLTSYQYFQSFWENRIVYQMDCDRAVSCPDPATHMPCVLGKIICSFLIWTADTCYMGSLNILPVINIKSLFTFHGQFCSFFHQDMFIWKDISTYCFGVRKNIYVSNNDYPSTVIINHKDLAGITEQSNCRESMKHSLWVAGSWDKADIMLAKSPGLFPWWLLTIILLSIFEPCPGSWSKTPENCGIFVFHRCQDCQSGIRFNKGSG